jgi:glutamate/tyrosine decarboxylase-like PLP-dependent enzyme
MDWGLTNGQFYSLTSGTTVLGSFDPIDSVADICEKYNLWLHVDVSLA